MAVPPFIAALRRRIGHELLLLPTVVLVARDRRGHLLLVHERDAAAWTLPGGIMEPGETPAEAATRELAEETGLHAELVRILGVVGGPGCETTYPNGDRIAWVATVFGARLADSVPVPDGEEIGSARLFSPDEVDRLALRADAVRFLATESAAGPSAWFQPSPVRVGRGASR